MQMVANSVATARKIQKLATVGAMVRQDMFLNVSC